MTIPINYQEVIINCLTIYVLRKASIVLEKKAPHVVQIVNRSQRVFFLASNSKL